MVLMTGNKMTLSLGKSLAPFAFGFALVGGLAGCGGSTTSTTSITGSAPAPSPTVTVDRQAAGLMCDPAVIDDCGVGETGPGGGVVFYDAGSVRPWGRYLEAAPAGWNGTSGDPDTYWCDDDRDVPKAKSGIIGVGRNNTLQIRAVCYSGAANLANAYAGGGKTDWFLPSKDELNELYILRNIVGGFERRPGGEDPYYWSSSQHSLDRAWYQHFDGYLQADGDKVFPLRVRPVRAF